MPDEKLNSIKAIRDRMKRTAAVLSWQNEMVDVLGLPEQHLVPTLFTFIERDFISIKFLLDKISRLQKANKKLRAEAKQ